MYSNVSLTQKKCVRRQIHDKRKNEMDKPVHISNQVLFSPKRFAPLSARYSDLAGKVLMGSFSVTIAAEKDEGIMEVREVHLNGYVMYPWLYTVCEPGEGLRSRSFVRSKKKRNVPFRVDCRLEDH